MKTILICALVLAVGVPAVALGAGEGRSLIAGKRNPDRRRADARDPRSSPATARYSTRQSNLGAGGGAIYGCRADAIVLKLL